MGYSGIPSQGCLSCRKRRVKCDEQRPICQRCAKSGRECGGWREKWDLIFRDEGSKLAQKNSLDEVNTDGSSSPSSEGIAAVHLPDAISLKAVLGSPCMVGTTDVDGTALNFFIWSYTLKTPPQTVHRPRVPEIQGYLGCFEPLFTRADPGSLLETAGHAVSLAALGEHLQDNDIIIRSRRKYVAAMNLTRQEVNSLTSSNQLILAVLLLSLYEQISCPQGNLWGWTSHVRGAFEVAKLYKSNEPEDEITYRLLIATQNQNLMNSLQDPFRTRSALTGTLERLRRDTKIRPLIKYYTKLMDVKDNIAPFLEVSRADRAISPDLPISKWQEYLTTAQTVAEEISRWPGDSDKDRFTAQAIAVTLSSDQRLPIALLSEVKPWRRTTSIMSTTLWNAYKVALAVVTTLQMDLESLGSTWYGVEVNTSQSDRHKATVNSLGHAILSTVPFILFPDLLETTPFASNEFADAVILGPEMDWSSVHPARAGEVMGLLWPLHFVASESSMGSRVRDLAKDALAYIADHAGLKIARALMGTSFMPGRRPVTRLE